MLIEPPKKICLKDSNIHGIGVFCLSNITKGETIEICPFLAFPHSNKEKIPVFANYTFSFPKSVDWTTQALVLGYASYYNHSRNPNADWYTDVEKKLFVFHAIKHIGAGEEILINYSNGVIFDNN